MTRFSLSLIRKRIAFLFLAVLGAAFLLTTRLAYLQIVQNQRYTDLALDQRLRGVPVDPRRGTIYDRNLHRLAVSISADAAYARPAEVEDPEATAQRLAPILEVPAAELAERLTQRRAEVWLHRRLTPEQARQVQEANLPGIRLAVRSARYYPNGSLAAHVLGAVGIDNQGLEGIEVQYEGYLRGVPGRELLESDARGREIPDGLSRFVPPQDGQDVVLTIDQVIQYVTERELEKAVLQTQSRFGIAVFVRPRTGEILSMAVYPTFDPNRFGQFPLETRRNLAVTDQFEPGSVFKVITGAAALEEGLVRADEAFFDPGHLEVGGGRIHCWRGGGHGSLTFAEAVEVSCNPVFAELGALRLGPERFYRHITAFGLGSRLGIDFPGEAAGSVPKPGQIRWGEVLQWANIGFGQGVAATPLQLLMATAAIANDGVLMQPRLVHEVRDEAGRVRERWEPVPIRRVLATETAREFARMLRSVVVNGSGRNAEVPGYRVAGKTGTAEIPERGGYGEGRIASFVGFAPVDDPQLAGIIMLYDLQVHPRYGGVHAAPVLRAIMEQALDYLGVPRRLDAEEGSGTPAGEDGLVRVPNVRNLPRGDAEAFLAETRLRPRLLGSGSYVMDQSPAPGARVRPGTAVLLSFYDSRPEEEGEVTVPDVRGLSLRDAAALLADVGLTIRIEGRGVATGQEPGPGTRLPRQAAVAVRFEPPP